MNTNYVHKVADAFTEFSRETMFMAENMRKWVKVVCLSSSDNNRVVHLALHHRKRRVRNKNRHRIFKGDRT